MQRFECTTGGSNKYYEFETVRSAGRITVNGYYAAIGRAPQVAVIYDGDDEAEAQTALDRKIAEKLKHRYLPLGSGVDAPAIPQPSDVPIVWPMAANGIKEAEAARFITAGNYIAQEKLDGMRATIHVTATGLRIFSRSAGVADPTKPLEKTASIPHLAALRYPDLVGSILDCELLVPGLDAAGIAGEINSRFGAKKAQAYVFDLISLRGKKLNNVGLETRINYLRQADPNHSEYITLLPYATSTDEKRALYDRIMNGKGEGIMFKNSTGSYVEGGRPIGNWFKLKKSITVDCIIVGFTRGEGKYNNSIGAVRFGQFINGKLTEIGQASGMTDALRDQFAANPDAYIGRVITIKGQERLKSGAIRHCQWSGFNIQKQPQDCVWYPNEQ